MSALYFRTTDPTYGPNPSILFLLLMRPLAEDFDSQSDATVPAQVIWILPGLLGSNPRRETFSLGCIGLMRLRTDVLDKKSPWNEPGAHSFLSLVDMDRWMEVENIDRNTVFIVATQPPNDVIIRYDVSPETGEMHYFRVPEFEEGEDLVGEGAYNYATQLPGRSYWEDMNHGFNQIVPEELANSIVNHYATDPKSKNPQYNQTIYTFFPVHRK